MKGNYRFFKGPFKKKDNKWSVYSFKNCNNLEDSKDVAMPGGKIPKVGTS